MLHGVTLSPGNSEGFHFHTFISPHETANSSIPEINSPEANKTTKIMIKPRKGRLNVQVGNHLLKNQTLLDLVDGSEIRRSPVEGQVVFPIIYRVSAPSQVVQDFSHQQYQLFHPSISGLSDWMFFCSLRFLLKKKIQAARCNSPPLSVCTFGKRLGGISLYHLESRWRNSHVLADHGPLLSHLVGVAPSTFTRV